MAALSLLPPPAARLLRLRLAACDRHSGGGGTAIAPLQSALSLGLSPRKVTGGCTHPFPLQVHRVCMRIALRHILSRPYFFLLHPDAAPPAGWLRGQVLVPAGCRLLPQGTATPPHRRPSATSPCPPACAAPPPASASTLGRAGRRPRSAFDVAAWPSRLLFMPFFFLYRKSRAAVPGRPRRRGGGAASRCLGEMGGWRAGARAPPPPPRRQPSGEGTPLGFRGQPGRAGGLLACAVGGRTGGCQAVLTMQRCIAQPQFGTSLPLHRALVPRAFVS